jgi:hypothetical protein
MVAGRHTHDPKQRLPRSGGLTAVSAGDGVGLHSCFSFFWWLLLLSLLLVNARRAALLCGGFGDGVYI